MLNTWVLVADSSCAKIFKSDGRNILQEVSDLVHYQSKIHQQDMTTDLPGSNTGGGGSKHNLEGQTDVKEYEASNFAREINEYLKAGQHSGQFNQLIVVAPPEFLGILRGIFKADISRLISHEINKDLVKFSTPEIREHVFKKA